MGKWKFQVKVKLSPKIDSKKMENAVRYWRAVVHRACVI